MATRTHAPNSAVPEPQYASAMVLSMSDGQFWLHPILQDRALWSFCVSTVSLVEHHTHSVCMLQDIEPVQHQAAVGVQFLRSLAAPQ